MQLFSLTIVNMDRETLKSKSPFNANGVIRFSASAFFPKEYVAVAAGEPEQILHSPCDRRNSFCWIRPTAGTRHGKANEDKEKSADHAGRTLLSCSAQLAIKAAEAAFRISPRRQHSHTLI